MRYSLFFKTVSLKGDINMATAPLIRRKEGMSLRATAMMLATCLFVAGLVFFSLTHSGESLIKIPQMMPEIPTYVAPRATEIEDPVDIAPFTVISMAIAASGDGCLSMLGKLGIFESDAKELLGSDRLSWCAIKADEVGRRSYWHHDHRRLETPKICLNKIRGKDTVPERWMFVLLPDGKSEVRIPDDSSLCAKP